MTRQNTKSRSGLKRMALLAGLAGLGLLGLLLAAGTPGKKPKAAPRKKKAATPTKTTKAAKPRTKAVVPKTKSRVKPQPKLPEQKLGDTPVAPAEMPTPVEKAKARPVRKALQQAVAQVDTPQKAEAVADQLLSQAGGQTVEETKQATTASKPATSPDPLTQSAEAVKQQAAATPEPTQKAANVIAQMAQEINANEGREREALSEAAQEVLNPEQQGAAASATSSNRQYLREALLKRMKPLDAADARLFLAINHLPHNRLLNGFFYALTRLYQGGGAWYGLMGLALVLNRGQGWRVIRQVALPLTIGTLVVELPIKGFFRRRRPFIEIIQATVIGKKPGTWSFPSGHSAAAFGGAWLLSKAFPNLRWLLFILAGLVGFSRIYLGDHYPSDVASGAISGMLLGESVQQLQQAVTGRAASS